MKSSCCKRRLNIEAGGVLPIATFKQQPLMSVARYLVVTATLCVLAACRSTPREVTVTPLPTSYLHSAEVRLRLGQPKDPEIKFELISVADNLKTTIRLETGELLTARPGEYYGAPLAPLNLQLEAAFPETREAVFRWQLK